MILSLMQFSIKLNRIALMTIYTRNISSALFKVKHLYQALDIGKLNKGQRLRVILYCCPIHNSTFTRLSFFLEFHFFLQHLLLLNTFYAITFCDLLSILSYPLSFLYVTCSHVLMTSLTKPQSIFFEKKTTNPKDKLHHVQH